MQVDILDPNDPRWDAVLRTAPHDSFALPGYVELSARFDGGESVAVLAVDGDSRLLLPLILRKIPDQMARPGYLDASSPYGYPGIVLSVARQDDPAARRFLDEAMTAAIVALRERGVVSLFVRLHPLLPVDSGTLATHGAVVDHGQTVSIDLSRDEANLFSDLRRDHHRNLRRLDRLGFTAEIDEACRPESIARFVEVYHQTMDRLGATEAYYFDADYVRDLVVALHGRLAIVLIRDGDTVAAAGIVTELNGIVESYISGTRDGYVRLAPSKLKVRESAKWARARGNRIMHLGGGLGGAEAPLFRFKAGFSANRHLFQTARFVIDQPAYAELVAGWEVRAAEPAGDPTGFFPAYRAPLPLSAAASGG